MDSIWHVQAEDALGNSAFSRYYSNKEWAERKCFQLRRDANISRVGFRILRGNWEDCDV